MLELLKNSAVEQAKALKNKEISALELTKASIPPVDFKTVANPEATSITKAT